MYRVIYLASRGQLYVKQKDYDGAIADYEAALRVVDYPAVRDLLKEVEALKADAEEASKLRKEIRAKDLDFERVSSELESKKELVRALRRDAESGDRLKADAKVKDREIEELKAQLARSEHRNEELERELEAAHEAGAGKSEEQSAELEAIRAELEARKTMIKSLRADQERVLVLEASLDYGDGDPYQCVFIFRIRDGRIAHETAYWTKPFPAPEWRAPWVERM